VYSKNVLRKAHSGMLAIII